MLQGEHSAILSTFIKLPFAIKTFVLSTFEWRLKTGFTVCQTLGPCPRRGLDVKIFDILIIFFFFYGIICFFNNTDVLFLADFLFANSDLRAHDPCWARGQNLGHL